MKRTIRVGTMLMATLLMLPGCGRLIDWGKSNFYQAEEVNNYRCDIKPYIRSVTIYDQFTTKATFDASWLSDDVRATYADVHVERQGKDEERKNAILRRQLEENNHYITFYVLSLHDVKLGDPDSAWSFFLQVGNQQYQPIEIKEIELPYEYQIFFGNLWNRFKVPYRIRFNANDADGMPLLTPTIEAFELHMRSANKEHFFVWDLHNFKPSPEVKACKAEKEAVIKRSRRRERRKKIKAEQATPRTPRKKRRKRHAATVQADEEPQPAVERIPRKKRRKRAYHEKPERVPRKKRKGRRS